MQESRENKRSSTASRKESSSSTLFGDVSSEKVKNRSSRDKHHDTVGTLNSEVNGSQKTKWQTDDFELPDLLPSFEMYQNLHSTIPHSTFDTYSPEGPPFYEVTSSSRETSFDVQREPNVEMISGDTAGSENSDVNADLLRSASVSSYPISRNAPISNYDSMKGIPVEKIYTLPRVATPLAIEIYVTKTASKFGQPPEYESMLKEFTSGDIIHGYFTIENVSAKPIKFDMFYLTLEGAVTAKTKSHFRTQKTTKRFLRMADLGASWSYNKEDVNTGENLCGFFDPVDNSRFGLTSDRVLFPGDKRKKFFTFKIPNQLLDVTCKHGHFSHSLLSPSLGFDRPPSSNTEAANLKFCESLGYGRLPERGSPLLFRDFSGDSLVSYSINAMVVGKDATSGHMCLMREKKYSIRIIPFGFDSKPVSKVKCLKDLEHFDATVTKRLKKVQDVLSKSRRSAPIYEDDIRGLEESDQTTAPRRKYSWNPLSKNVKSEAVEKKYCSQEGDIESEMSYSMTSIFNMGFKGTFLKGLYNTSSSQVGHSTSGMNSEKNGLVMMKLKSPRNSLPYWSPPLIQRQNVFSIKNEQNQRNWSNLRQLLPIEQREQLETLEIELLCMQAANGIPHVPPELSSLQTELICLTEVTGNCKPMEFHTELLQDERKYNEVKKRFQEILTSIETYGDEFTNEQTRINSLLVDGAQASLNNKQLSFFDLMPLNLISDVQTLAQMKVDVVVMKNALKSRLVKAKDVHSNSSSSSSSIIPRASRSTVKSTVSNSGNSLLAHWKSNEWDRLSATEYTKTLCLDIKFNEELKTTIVPDFQSCLCSRSYFLRVKLNFEKGAGTSQIDIPIQIRNCHIEYPGAK